MSREGKIEGNVGQEQRRIQKPAVSPDGQRVAVMALEGENWDIWVHEVSTATRTRLTFHPVTECGPLDDDDGA